MEGGGRGKIPHYYWPGYEATLLTTVLNLPQSRNLDKLSSERLQATSRTESSSSVPPTFNKRWVYPVSKIAVTRGHSLDFSVSYQDGCRSSYGISKQKKLSTNFMGSAVKFNDHETYFHGQEKLFSWSSSIISWSVSIPCQHTIYSMPGQQKISWSVSIPCQHKIYSMPTEDFMVSVYSMPTDSFVVSLHSKGKGTHSWLAPPILRVSHAFLASLGIGFAEFFSMARALAGDSCRGISYFTNDLGLSERLIEWSEEYADVLRAIRGRVYKQVTVYKWHFFSP